MFLYSIAVLFYHAGRSSHVLGNVCGDLCELHGFFFLLKDALSTQKLQSKAKAL